MTVDIFTARELIEPIEQLNANLRNAIELTSLAGERSTALVERSKLIIEALNDQTQEQLEP